MGMSQGLQVSRLTKAERAEWREYFSFTGSSYMVQPIEHCDMLRVFDECDVLETERDDLARQLRAWVCPECMGRVDVHDTARMCRDSACGWRETT